MSKAEFYRKQHERKAKQRKEDRAEELKFLKELVGFTLAAFSVLILVFALGILSGAI